MTADIDTVLGDKQQQIESQLTEMTRQPDDIGTISFGKRVGEGTNQAVERLASVSAHDKLTAMLEEVVRARVKLAEGTYRQCDACGRGIGAARQEARPWATRCIEHA